MLRKLRVLAAFFMLPVVMFLNPQAAAAAIGPWVPVSISLPIGGGLLGDDIPGQGTCSFSLQHTGTSSINVGQGSCFGLPDVTWGYTQPMEAGSNITISASGVTAAGAPCDGAMATSLAQHEDNGTVRVAGTITPGDFGVSAADCSITEVCVTVPRSSECDSVSLPFPEEEETGADGCPHGTPTAHVYSVFETGPGKDGGNGAGWGTVSWYVDVTINGAPPISTAGWGWYVPQFDYANGGSGSRRGQVVNGTSRYLLSSVVKHEGNAEFFRQRHPLAGAQVYAWPTEGDWTAAYPNAQAELPPSGTDTIPPGADDRYLGWTDPVHCRFWFGPKIAQADGTTLDDPAGDGASAVPYEPVVVDPGPAPVVDEPDPIAEPETEQDWLGQIWSGLDWLKRFFETFWQKLTTAITGLFVPSDGYMEARWDGVESEWAGTSPGKYLDTVSGLQVGSVSGCGGLPLNVTLPGGVQVSENIGAACSGSMASAASITRAVLSASLLIGGAFACIRGVGSGLGWNPGVGGRGAEA